MGFASPYLIDKILFPEAQKPSEDFVSTYSRTGPGQLDSYQAFMEGKENSWRQLATANANEIKKRIIISNVLLVRKYPTDFQLSVISRLVKNYDVYFWSGTHTRFSETKLIKSTKDFWSQRDTLLNGATANEVKDELSHQGETTKNTVFLDFNEYEIFFKKLGDETQKIEPDFNPDPHDPSCLDLKEIPSTVAHLTYYLKSIDPTKIKTIEINAPNREEIEFLQEKFPNAMMVVVGVTDNWAKDHLFRFKHYPLTLKDSSQLKNIVVPNNDYLIIENIAFESLVYVNHFDIKSQKIYLINCANQYKDLPSFGNIEFTFDTDKPEKHMLYIPGLEPDFLEKPIKPGSEEQKFNLETNKSIIPTAIQTGILLLEHPLVQNYVFNTITKEDCAKIRFLSFVVRDHSMHTNPKFISFLANLTNLESLTLTYASIGDINFASFTKLQNLHLINCSVTELKNMPLQSLLRLNVTYTIEADLRYLFALNKLNLDQYPELEELNLEHKLPASGNIDAKREYVIIDSTELTPARQLKQAHFKNIFIKDIVEIEAYQLNFSEHLESCVLAAIPGDFNLTQIPSSLIRYVYQHPKGTDHPHWHEHECSNKTLEYFDSTASHTPDPFYLINMDRLKKAVLNGGTAIFVENCPMLSYFKFQGNEKAEITTDGGSSLTVIHIKNNKEVTLNLGTVSSETLRSTEGVPPSSQNQNTTSVNSPVSYIVPEDEAPANLLTGVPNQAYTPNVLAAVKVAIYSAKANYNPEQYRSNVLDTIIYDEKNGALAFKRTLDEKNLEPYDAKKIQYLDSKTRDALFLTMRDQKITREVGVFEKDDVDPNKYYALTTVGIPSKVPFQIASEPSDSIDVFWSVKHEQYFIKPKTRRKIKLLYSYHPKPISTQSISLSEIETELKKLPKSILPPEVIRLINSPLFTEHPKLKFLFDAKQSLPEKLDLIYRYCKEFKGTKADEKLQAVPGLDLNKKFDYSIASFLQQKGACGPRSECGMMLSQFLGVPANLNRNAIHRNYECHDGASLQQLDSGGENWEMAVPQNLLTDLFSAEEKSPIPQNLQALQAKKPENPYTKVFIQLLEPKKINSIIPLLKKGPPASLIVLKENDTLDSLKKSIQKELAELKDHRSRFLYINNPEDFRRYLKPYTLQEGTRKRKDGPLMTILSEGGTLIINWSNFTATELASYKSVLENSTLLGVPVSAKVACIGLLTSDKRRSLEDESFLSRNQLYDYTAKTPEILIEMTDPKDSKDSKEEFIEIDLFNREDWREILLGKVITVNQQRQFQEGILKQAFDSKKSIKMINPPKDSQLEQLIKQINTEHRFFLNGKWIEDSHPYSVHVKIETKVHDNELKDQVIIQLENKPERDTKDEKNLIRHHLRADNLFECYEKLVIDNKNQTENKATGLLQNYDEKSHIFYVTDTLPLNEWQRLLHKIKTDFSNPKKTFTFLFERNAGIQGILKNTTAPLPSERRPQECPVIFTNDPNYMAESIAREMKATLIDVTANTQFSDLFYKTTYRQDAKDESKITFQYEETELLARLKRGETIIFNGVIIPNLFKQIKSLLETPAYLDCNGIRTSIPGKVIHVLDSSLKSQITTPHFTEKMFNLTKYKANFLKRALNEESKIKIETLFTFLAWAMTLTPPGNQKSLRLNYQRIHHMLEKITSNDAHPQNPLKGTLLYDYPKESEQYALMNIIAKLHFSPKISKQPNWNKFKSLLQKRTNQNNTNLVFQLLNCFSGKDLSALLGFNLNQHLVLSPEVSFTKVSMLIIDQWISKQESLLLSESKVAAPADQKKNASPPSHSAKREVRLNKLIHDEKTSLIFLKGLPGVGKTYGINQLKNITLFDGEANIEKWLTSDAKNAKVLLLDEANMLEPDKWEFLKGLHRNPKQIYYNGKFHTLSNQHKVVITGNPENFPERYYHPYFQDYAETIYCKMPDKIKLIDDVIVPTLGLYGAYHHSDHILAAYFEMRHFNPTYYFSNRDLENLCTDIATRKEGDLHEKIFRASIAEFSGTIYDPEKRSIFIKKMEDKFKLKMPILDPKGLIEIKPNNPNAKSIFIPNENEFLVSGISRILRIRDNVIQKPGLKHKQGMLIDGAPGLGKSTLYKAMLESQGFKEGDNATDPTRRYYEISAGSSEAYHKLRKAFIEGAVVILDEINLDERLEFLLNQLLTGKYPLEPDEKEIPKIKPGFIILSSQNKSHGNGRKPPSPALFNRLDVKYTQPLSANGLLALATQQKIAEPERFVEAFLESKTTMRAFYYVLERTASLNVGPSATALYTTSLFTSVDDKLTTPTPIASSADIKTPPPRPQS